MYAIIDINGKQYKARNGEVINIDLIDKKPGDTVEFDNVLFISDGESVQLGAPTIEKAKVSATVIDEWKDKKIIAFKYRRRKDSRRKKGHRQRYTRVKIDKIG
mgnify:CR=1 FL=1